jgi:hypothetical protein
VLNAIGLVAFVVLMWMTTRRAALAEPAAAR